MVFGKQRGNASPQIFRCSFCIRSQRDVAQLVAGPGVYICNECVDICNDIMADDKVATESMKIADPTVEVGGPLEAAVRCGLCQMLWPTDDSVAFPDRGWLCSACLDNVRLYLDSGG